MGMRQLGAPVKHETSHPSALLGTPSHGCAGPCRRHYRTGGGTKASARRPPRTGTAGSWVGARCCARSLGRRPPVAVPRVGAPLSPARRQHGRAADSQWDPRPQSTGGLHRGWMVGENRPAGARHALGTPQGPHAVRSASSRFASHAKGRRSCVEDRRVQAVANTLLTKDNSCDLR